MPFFSRNDLRYARHRLAHALALNREERVLLTAEDALGRMSVHGGWRCLACSELTLEGYLPSQQATARLTAYGASFGKVSWKTNTVFPLYHFAPVNLDEVSRHTRACQAPTNEPGIEDGYPKN